MTTRHRNGSEARFNAWLRAHPDLDSIKKRLSITDCDFWIHQFKRKSDKIGARYIDNIMLVELKTNAKEVDYAQRDTLFLLNQLRLQLHHGPTGRRRHVAVKGPRGEMRVIRFFGVHVLMLSGTDPTNSTEMSWDYTKIGPAELVSLLTFDLDPDCVTKRLDYRRHHTSAKVQQLRLVDDAA